jgi:hypothetical protein
MSTYETYVDVLSEHAARRNVLGSAILTVLILALALLAVSVL